MGFLIASPIVCSCALHGELYRTKQINQICCNQLDAPLQVGNEPFHVRSTGRVKEIGLYNEQVFGTVDSHCNVPHDI